MTDERKNKDNRIRNISIAFHASDKEKDEIERRINLSGYMTKQEYYLECLLTGKVKAVGNPLMLVSFRKELRDTLQHLQECHEENETLENMYSGIKRMLEILEAFAERDGM